MKKHILLFLFILNFVELTAQVNPYEVVQNMGRGINLGNTLSAPVEGNWAAVVYEQYFIDVKNEGFSNVRIPVDFYGSRTSGSTASFSATAGTAATYNGSLTDFNVSQSYMDRLQTLVDWSLTSGDFGLICGLSRCYQIHPNW